MILQMKKKDCEFEVSLEYFTQLCGTNFILKSFIVDAVSKYFGKGKYTESELELQDCFRLDGEKVGRDYVDLIRIRDRDELLAILKLLKASLLSQFINAKLSEMDYQYELEIIANSLEKIYTQLNLGLERDVPEIRLDYTINEIFDMVMQSEVLGSEERKLYQLSNAELISAFLNLIQENERISPSKRIIIIENIDHLLDYHDYVECVEKSKKISNESDVYFIVTTSIEGYVYISEDTIKGINIINDVVYSLPAYDYLVEFLEKNYPCLKKEIHRQLPVLLRSIIHKIAKKGNVINMEGLIILKLLNQSMCINNDKIEKLNKVENSFLFE